MLLCTIYWAALVCLMHVCVCVHVAMYYCMCADVRNVCVHMLEMCVCVHIILMYLMIPRCDSNECCYK